MIFFQDDWRNENGILRAVPHLETRNITFKRIAVVLQRMGVRNNAFHLALSQPDLAKYDPHNLTDNSVELKLRILHEARINIWYYLREFVRIPESGNSVGIRFELNRANLAMAWCYSLNIDYFGVQPRQTGKTIGAIAISARTIYISGRRINMFMFTKDNDLRTTNVGRLKAIRDTLPEWAIIKSKGDSDNKEGVYYSLLDNTYSTYVAQSEPAAADKQGRGITSPSGHIDEVAHAKNIKITYGAINAATTAARASAKRNGQPHCNIYTATPAPTDDPDGAFAYKLLCDSMRFTEKLYDLKNRDELITMVNSNSTNGIISGVYSYLQLGKDKEWFNDVVRKTQLDPSGVNRELLNKWEAGVDLALVDKVYLERMIVGQFDANDPSGKGHVQIIHDYAIFWYVSEEVRINKVRNGSYILSMDTADGIGRDFTVFTLIDPTSLEVVATFKCNIHNIHKIGLLIGTLLIENRKWVWIPERKSSAVAIIDSVIVYLIEAGINPLFRIFSYMVQDRSSKFKDINLNDVSICDTEYKKYIGFMTTKDSRSILYGSVMKPALSAAAELIHDKMIIDEFRNIKVINGRIDHKGGHHDDGVISYLIGCWLVFFGKNLEYYGLDPDKLLSESNTADADRANHIKAQLELRKQIAHLRFEMERAENVILRANYRKRITELTILLDDSVAIDPINPDQITNTIKNVGTGIYGYSDGSISNPVRKEDPYHAIMRILS